MAEDRRALTQFASLKLVGYAHKSLGVDGGGSPVTPHHSPKRNSGDF
jgi:hypothetical protein